MLISIANHANKLLPALYKALTALSSCMDRQVLEKHTQCLATTQSTFCKTVEELHHNARRHLVDIAGRKCRNQHILKELQLQSNQNFQNPCLAVITTLRFIKTIEGPLFEKLEKKQPTFYLDKVKMTADLCHDKVRQRMIAGQITSVNSISPPKTLVMYYHKRIINSKQSNMQIFN